MKYFLTIGFFLFSALPAFAESFPPDEEDNSWQYSRPSDFEFKHPNSPEETESAKKRRRARKEKPRRSEMAYERQQYDRMPDSEPQEETLAEETQRLVADEPPRRSYKVAAVEPEPAGSSEEKVTAENPQTGSAFLLRLGVLLGMTNVSSDDQRTQTSRSEQALSQNFLLGLNADVQYARYFGAEVDAFMGIAPAVTISTTGTNSSERMKSMKQSGALANLKLQYPVSPFFTPKLGVGYGMLGLSQTDEAAGQSSSASASYKGIYAVAGFDVRLSEDFLLTLDYAQSLSTSVGITANTNGQVQTVDLTGGGFNRIRVAGYLKVAPKFYGGLQFTSRKLKEVGDAAQGASLFGEGLTQFMAVGMIEF